MSIQPMSSELMSVNTIPACPPTLGVVATHPTPGRLRPCRLLIVSPTLSEGGAERFVSTLLSRIDRSRFAPTLCLARPNATYPLPGHVACIDLGKRHVWDLPRAVRHLARVVDHLEPDVVLSAIGFANRLTGLALGLAKRRPRWIARIGNAPAHHESALGHFLNRRLYTRIDTAVANSRGLAASVVASYPFLSGKVQVVGNPTDFDVIDACAIEPPLVRAVPDVPVILAVNRLHRQKRPDVLLAAFEQLHRRMPAELWICGDGPLRRQVERAVIARGLADSVRSLGFCENPYALMKQAALLVLTSDHEGLPNALIEAQGLGLPAISSRCPYGPDEIIEDGTTGLLVPPGDVEGFSRAMEELLADPQRRAAMGKAAAERARRLFLVGPLIDAWEEVIAPRGESRSQGVGVRFVGSCHSRRNPSGGYR